MSATATDNKTFEYTVRNKDGKIVKGRLEARAQSAVAARLRTMGTAPLSVIQARLAASVVKNPAGGEGCVFAKNRRPSLVSTRNAADVSPPCTTVDDTTVSPLARCTASVITATAPSCITPVSRLPPFS